MANTYDYALVLFIFGKNIIITYLLCLIFRNTSYDDLFLKLMVLVLLIDQIVGTMVHIILKSYESFFVLNPDVWGGSVSAKSVTFRFGSFFGALETLWKPVLYTSLYFIFNYLDKTYDIKNSDELDDTHLSIIIRKVHNIKGLFMCLCLLLPLNTIGIWSRGVFFHYKKDCKEFVEENVKDFDPKEYIVKRSKLLNASFYHKLKTLKGTKWSILSLFIFNKKNCLRIYTDQIGLPVKRLIQRGYNERGKEIG